MKPRRLFFLTKGWNHPYSVVFSALLLVLGPFMARAVMNFNESQDQRINISFRYWAEKNLSAPTLEKTAINFPLLLILSLSLSISASSTSSLFFFFLCALSSAQSLHSRLSSLLLLLSSSFAFLTFLLHSLFVSPDIGVWNISTMTFAKAASSPAVLPRDIRCNTPWSSTALRYEHTHTHTHWVWMLFLPLYSTVNKHDWD